MVVSANVNHSSPVSPEDQLVWNLVRTVTVAEEHSGYSYSEILCCGLTANQCFEKMKECPSKELTP